MIIECPASGSICADSWQVPSDAVPFANISMRRHDPWSEVDVRLSRWAKNVSSLVDAGRQPPSLMTIRIARACSYELSKRFPPPDMISADGNGGITFEWNNDPFSHTLEISASSPPELSTYQDNRFVRSEILPAGILLSNR